MTSIHRWWMVKTMKIYMSFSVTHFFTKLIKKSIGFDKSLYIQVVSHESLLGYAVRTRVLCTLAKFVAK